MGQSHRGCAGNRESEAGVDARGSGARPASASRQSLVAAERVHSDMAEGRRFWIGRRLPIMPELPRPFVFIDEASRRIKLARSRQGADWPRKSSHRRRSRQSFLKMETSRGRTAPIQMA